MAESAVSISVKTFFDSAAVTAKVTGKTRRVLSKMGAFVRRRAKSSIRKRKKPAAPGQAPSSHEGSLRRLIYFSYDFDTESLVVGPVPFGSRGGVVPGVLEKGGAVAVTRQVPYTPKGGRPATKRQRRAFLKLVKEGRIVREKRPLHQVTIKIAKRPFMVPAMKAEYPKFKHQLKNLMRK